MVFVRVRTSLDFFSSGLAVLEPVSVVAVTGVSEVAGAEGTVSFSVFSVLSFSRSGASSFITFTSSVVSS